MGTGPANLGETLRTTRLSLWYVMVRYGQGALALTDVLADRIQRVLPEDEYKVEAAGLALIVKRCDAPASTSGAPALMLATPGSRDDKLRRVLKVVGAMVGELVAPDWVPRVEVTPESIGIWWEGASGEIVMRLRNIERDEINL